MCMRVRMCGRQSEKDERVYKVVGVALIQAGVFA